MISLSVLFIKGTFICTAAAVVSDGSSPSMVPSAAVLCPLMQLGICQVAAITPTGTEQCRATVATFTRVLSVWVSTLETVLEMETLMAQQAGCQSPA